MANENQTNDQTTQQSDDQSQNSTQKSEQQSKGSDSNQSQTTTDTTTTKSPIKTVDKFYKKDQTAPVESKGAAAGVDGKGADDKSAAASATDQTQAQKDSAVAGDKTEQKVERVVPEAYDVKLPEAAVVKPAAIERITAKSRELGLTNSEAQAALEMANAEVAAFKADELAIVNAEKDNWKKSFEADPIIGGKNAKESSELSRRVLEEHGTPELKKLLDVTEFGNHPEVIRLFSKLGRKLIKEAKIPPGNPPPRQKITTSQKFYGDKMKQ